MLELSGLKNTLFHLNLSVHNLLAEVSSCGGFYPTHLTPHNTTLTSSPPAVNSDVEEITNDVDELDHHYNGSASRDSTGGDDGPAQRRSSQVVGGRVVAVHELHTEVVQLYTVWDNAHHKMAAGLSRTQVCTS